MNATKTTIGVIVLGIVLAAAAPNVFARLSASGPIGSVSDSYQHSQWVAYQRLIESSVNGNNVEYYAPTSPPSSPIGYAPSSIVTKQQSWEAYQKMIESSVNPNQSGYDSAKASQWAEYQRMIESRY